MKHMFLTDTHCHLNREYYPNGLEEVFKNALDNNVKRMIFASAEIESSRESVEISSKQISNPEIYSLVGVHPHEAEKVSPNFIGELEALASHERVCAIGEIGLDYFYDHSPRDIQKEIFIAQIELAKKLDMPIALHIRDSADRQKGNANAETIEILREHGAEKIGGVVHCFSGDMNNAKDALDLGFYISFAGPVTYPKNISLREIAMEIPTDRILCETDSPYLAPQGFRGKSNEPYHVKSVYEMISMLKGISVEDFAAIVDDNVKKAFRLGKKDV